MIKIAVGSKNPVKINAVKEAFRKYFKKIIVTAVEAKSRVSNQPKSEEEAIKGAINRARFAIKSVQADFGVGIEGSVRKVQNYGEIEAPWFVIIDKEGLMGMAGGGGFLIPKKVSLEIRKGKELGQIIDELAKTSNSKQKMGAIGFFTKGVIDRKEYYKNYVIMALVKFINKKLFD